MALCVITGGPSGLALSGTGQAVNTGNGYTCASGQYLLLTIPEVTELGKKLTVDDASNPERVADMTALFYVFLAAFVAVWAIKQLANLFTGDTDRG